MTQEQMKRLIQAMQEGRVMVYPPTLPDKYLPDNVTTSTSGPYTAEADVIARTVEQLFPEWPAHLGLWRPILSFPDLQAEVWEHPERGQVVIQKGWEGIYLYIAIMRALEAGGLDELKPFVPWPVKRYDDKYQAWDFYQKMQPKWWQQITTTDSTAEPEDVGGDTYITKGDFKFRVLP